MERKRFVSFQTKRRREKRVLFMYMFSWVLKYLVSPRYHVRPSYGQIACVTASCRSWTNGLINVNSVFVKYHLHDGLDLHTPSKWLQVFNVVTWPPNQSQVLLLLSCCLFCCCCFVCLFFVLMTAFWDQIF